MKKLAPLLLILALMFGGYYVYTNYMGGSVGAPTNTPDVDLPDVNPPGIDDVGDGAGDAAEQADKSARELSDTIAGLPEVFWRVVGVFLCVAAVVWIWRDPKRRTIALLVGLVGLVVFITTST